MNLEPPQPPTAPAPAIRPTPPTPPRIDRTPFVKDSADDTPQVTRKVDDPESMARDAVANGSGALTKRTVERGDDEQNPPPNQVVTVIPPDAPLVDTQSDYDRGQDVLRQFREMDARDDKPAYSPPAHTSTEQPRPVAHLNYHEGHGGVFWLFTIIFVAIAAVVVVKKFLLTDKPTLTKSQLFEDKTDRLKAAADKVKPVTPPKSPIPNPQSLVPNQNDKGKHFEVRV